MTNKDAISYLKTNPDVKWWVYRNSDIYGFMIETPDGDKILVEHAPHTVDESVLIYQRILTKSQWDELCQKSRTLGGWVFSSRPVSIINRPDITRFGCIQAVGGEEDGNSVMYSIMDKATPEEAKRANDDNVNNAKAVADEIN